MVALISLLSSVISVAFFAAQAPQVYAAPALNAIYPFAPIMFIAQESSKNLTQIPESAIPSTCTSQCSSDSLMYLSNCTTAMCDCQDSTFNTISSCLDCLVANKAINAQTEANLRTEYTGTCQTFGITLANGSNAAVAALSNMIFGATVDGLGLGHVNLGMVGTVVMAALLSVVV